MGITTVTDQNYANLTAYLNRAMAPVCGGSPTPTPTPISDTAAGQMIFQVTCRSCHNPPSNLRNHSASDISEALRAVSQMRGITLTTEQIRVIAVYLKTV